MNSLKILTSDDIIQEKLSKIINRSERELTECVIQTIIDMYKKMISHGDFCIEALLDSSQSHDECLLYEIAEEKIRTDPELKYYEKCKEKYGDNTYDDIIDDIVNEYIIDYNIMLFLGVPPYSKSTIPYEFSFILDKIGASYNVVYPPPGSFEAYIGRIKTNVWYNDAQNSLCEECAVHDQSDNSLVNACRPVEECMVYIE